MGLYRGERWEITYDVEDTYGAAPNNYMTATNLFGVFDAATLPDPTFEHQPKWLMNPANRNYYVAYKGLARSNGSIPNITLLDGRPLFLPIADTIVHTGSEAPYTHTINETVGLPSIRLVATNISSEDTSPDELCRWFVGGKVDRASYMCEQGGTLMMSLDTMMFKMPYFKDSVPVSDLSPWYDADVARQSFTYTCNEPYYFSQGLIKMKVPYLGSTEVTIPSVRSFKIDVSNALEPKYYISTNTEKVPYQIYEGRRTYRLAMQVDLVDHISGFTKDTPLLELLNQGMDTTFKGAAIDITFTRGANDTIQFVTPADYTPACGGESQGALIVSAPMPVGGGEGVLSVSMEMICRNLKIVVVDSIAGTSYPA